MIIFAYINYCIKGCKMVFYFVLLLACCLCLLVSSILSVNALLADFTCEVSEVKVLHQMGLWGYTDMVPLGS